MESSFYDDAYRKFSAMGMPELIDEYNRRVMMGYRGGWGVWGPFRRQIDMALVNVLRERPIDLSDVDQGEWLDFSQLVTLDVASNKLVQRGMETTVSRAEQRKQFIIQQSQETVATGSSDTDGDDDELPF